MLIIILITVAFIYNMILNHLNNQSVKRPIPDNVKGIYNDNEYQKWLSYKHDQNKVNTIAIIVNFVILITLLLTRVFNYFVTLTEDVLLNPYFSSIFIILIYLKIIFGIKKAA